MTYRKRNPAEVFLPDGPQSRPRRLLLPLLFLLPALACNAPGAVEPAGTTEPDPEISPGEISLDEALDVTPVDRRDSVLEELGAPDVFTIIFEDLEGMIVRSEQWSYLDYETRYDFVDGELLWMVELEPVPDASIYAQFYDPLEFTALMTTAEMQSMLAGQDLESFELAEGDLPGAVILAGDQIILGFDQDQLVYVETLMLSPEEGS